ncbi:MAG: hypothetical protein DIU71_13985 [Proteobacteria bacterium]|nr:MAG: hypothetical protein DIU71_13985 [Pseudomonadota bacterium]
MIAMRALIGMFAAALMLAAAGCGQDRMGGEQETTGPMDQPADTGPTYTPPAEEPPAQQQPMEPSPQDQSEMGTPPPEEPGATTPPGETTQPGTPGQPGETQPPLQP